MGTPRIAVHLFSWGSVKHPKDDFEVNRKLYVQMKASHEFITSRGKHPPVLRQHTEDGFGWGKVIDIFTDDQAPDYPLENKVDRPGVWASVELSAGAQKAWEDGNIVDWSPGFFPEWEDRHTDKTLKNFLRELSFVSVGHLYNTNTASPRYSLSDGGFIENAQKKEKAMEPEDKSKDNESTDDLMSAVETLTGQVGALVERIDGLDERLKAVEGNGGESEMGDDERGSEMADDGPTKENAASTELADRVEQLERQLADEKTRRQREKARADISDRGLSLEGKERDDLIQLATVDTEAFTATLNVLTRQAEKARKLSDEGSKKSGQRFHFGEVGGVGEPKLPRGYEGELRKLCQDAASREEARRMIDSQKLVNWMDGNQARTARGVLDEVHPSR